jgi:hypothetical protein
MLRELLIVLFLTESKSAAAFTYASTRNARPFKSSLRVVAASEPATQRVAQLKTDLIRACQTNTNVVPDYVRQLESHAEQKRVSQASSVSGWLSGEWELLYAPDDVTRSSPFFWAFAQAFPDQADSIFWITDGIPAPIKHVGPAYQTIHFMPTLTTTSNSKNNYLGELVSRVQVSTLGGLSSSVMTTRATITGVDDNNNNTSIQLTIATTTVEESTLLKTVFGNTTMPVPAFPSGQVLERVMPGSSQVTMRTTFCDEGLRISRNEAKLCEPFVWRRRAFASRDEIL